MIDEMVHIRDFELMVSETEMSKAGRGPMNIEIHWALADELITMLLESYDDAARYRFIRDDATDYHIGEFFSTEVNDRDACIDSLIEQLNLRMNRLKAKAIIK